VPFVETEPGVRLHAQDVGTGPPIVLLAGFGLSHPVWDRQVRVLGERHRVVCIDLRGTGNSDKPYGAYDVDRLARDVDAVIEHLDLHEATLVGWSFGGQVAFHLAATAAHRVARLVLVCSNGVRGSRSDEFPFGPPADALEAALIGAENGARIASRRRTLAAGFGRPPDDDLLDWLLRCQLEMPSWAAVACYRSYLRTDLLDDLPRITMPVLQIMGSDDPVTPIEGARWLQHRLPDARLVELPDCGHYPLFEAPDAFDATLLEFARA